MVQRDVGCRLGGERRSDVKAKEGRRGRKGRTAERIRGKQRGK